MNELCINSFNNVSEDIINHIIQELQHISLTDILIGDVHGDFKIILEVLTNEFINQFKKEQIYINEIKLCCKNKKEHNDIDIATIKESVFKIKQNKYTEYIEPLLDKDLTNYNIYLSIVYKVKNNDEVITDNDGLLIRDFFKHRKLILLGDIFDTHHDPFGDTPNYLSQTLFNITSEHFNNVCVLFETITFKFVKYLKEIVDTHTNNNHIILILGNHDARYNINYVSDLNFNDFATSNNYMRSSGDLDNINNIDNVVFSHNNKFPKYDDMSSSLTNDNKVLFSHLIENKNDDVLTQDINDANKIYGHTNNGFDNKSISLDISMSRFKQFKNIKLSLINIIKNLNNIKDKNEMIKLLKLSTTTKLSIDISMMLKLIFTTHSYFKSRVSNIDIVYCYIKLTPQFNNGKFYNAFVYYTTGNTIKHNTNDKIIVDNNPMIGDFNQHNIFKPTHNISINKIDVGGSDSIIVKLKHILTKVYDDIIINDSLFFMKNKDSMVLIN